MKSSSSDSHEFVEKSIKNLDTFGKIVFGDYSFKNNSICYLHND